MPAEKKGIDYDCNCIYWWTAELAEWEKGRISAQQ